MIQQLRRRKRAQGGFTLIELLVVIVVLGVLAAVVVFAIRGITDRGKQSACRSDLRTVTVASEAYAAQYGRYAPDISELVRVGRLKSAPSSSSYRVDYQVSADGKSADVSSSFCTRSPTPLGSTNTGTYCEQLRVTARTYGTSDLTRFDEVGYAALMNALRGMAATQPAEVNGVWTTMVDGYTRSHQILVDAGLQWSDLSALLAGQAPQGLPPDRASQLADRVRPILNSQQMTDAYNTIVNTSPSICGADIFS